MGNEISTGAYQELDRMKKYAGFSPGQVEMIRYFCKETAFEGY
jgi:hypothetical protein